MRTVNINFKKIEVTNFMSREGVVDFRVIVNTGGDTDKALMKSCVIDNPDQLTKEVISEIRQKAKAMGSSGLVREIGDGPLGGVVILRVQNDEEELAEKMARFFGSVRERIRSAKLARLSYFDMERKVKGMSADL
jgi:hypothetical protein